MSLGPRVLYDDLSWLVPKGTKTALVGNNGTGKTTLFRIILGETEPDEGTVTISRDARIGYLPQDLAEIENLPIAEWLMVKSGFRALEEEMRKAAEQLSGENALALSRHDGLVSRYEAQGGYGFEARARKVLKGLGFRDADMERESATFSGGWRMRLLLASVLLSAPDILLLDEPTNHLDTESMEWLEGWLSSFRGTLVAISHDQRFLDKLCPVTAELIYGKVRSWKGNFSYYLTASRQAREEQAKLQKNQQREIDRTEAFIERFRYKASKASQVQSRVKALEKMERLETDAELPQIHFRFPEAPPAGQRIVSLKGVGKCYGDLRVFGDVNLEIERGQTVALVGVNGAGKSTLSRLLSGIEPPTAGTVLLGHNVRVVCFSQESAQNLDYGHTIWEEISLAGKAEASQKRSLLGAFLFRGEDIHKPISVLSGGEKSRLSLLKAMLHESNFMVLDEPTNHLDRMTLQIFNEALLAYQGTVVLVSHDRAFLDNLATRVLEIR
jgi:ATP-binding cassette subfamily F protein 3